MLINIHLNNKLNFNVLKKNDNYFILIFDRYVFVKYVLSKHSNVYVSSNINYINIKLNFFVNYLYFQSIMDDINNNINNYFSKKITFIGKGYKLKRFVKNKKPLLHNLISFYFNTSHINIVYFFNIIVKKLKKTKIIVSSVNKNYLTNILKLILNIKRLNLFTQKGLRMSRQLVYKKIGKKSS